MKVNKSNDIWVLIKIFDKESGNSETWETILWPDGKLLKLILGSWFNTSF